MLSPGAALNNASLVEFGVAIIRTKPTQHHIAFVYEAADGTILMSHLRAHHRFSGRDPWTPTYHWTTVLSLSEIDRKFCASWLESLSKNPLVIAYGFDDSGCAFENDDAGNVTFVNKIPGKGLTCATFLLVVFDALGFRPLYRDTWPHRPGDAADQEDIRDDLRALKLMTQAELDLLSKDIGGVRYRPSEVAAVCAHPDWPQDFDSALLLADQIVNTVAELRLTPRP